MHHPLGRQPCVNYSGKRFDSWQPVELLDFFHGFGSLLFFSSQRVFDRLAE
jgi:hypothetical protein